MQQLVPERLSSRVQATNAPAAARPQVRTGQEKMMLSGSGMIWETLRALAGPQADNQAGLRDLAEPVRGLLRVDRFAPLASFDLDLTRLH